MKSFEYAAPGSVREAVALLGDTWGKTEVLAGGTDLLTSLKQNLTTPDRVVSLKNIASLKGIKEGGGNVRIGATTTLSELASNSVVREYFPALVQAANGIGSPQLMSMGTVGGDLCQRPRCWYYRSGFGLFGKSNDSSLVREGENRYHAIFGNEGPAFFVSASSLGPALIALDAMVLAEGAEGKPRRIAALEFFQTPKTEQERETVLKPNEILTAIEVPLKGLKNATYEVRHRQGLDWPYVTASVALDMRNGAVTGGRVALGHVAPVPWLSKPASDILRGGQPNEGLALRCGQAAAQGARPLGQNAYKTQLVKVAVKRALLAAAQA